MQAKIKETKMRNLNNVIKGKCLYIVLFLSTQFLANTIGQISIEKTKYFIRTVTLDKDAIENCFGYKLLECEYLHVLRHGIYKRNRSFLQFEYDDQGQITKFNLNSNNNIKLDYEDFKDCILPNIQLSKEKYRARSKKLTYNLIYIRFDNDINRANDSLRFVQTINNLVNNKITHFKKEKMLKASDWDTNIHKFNGLDENENTITIFESLENKSKTLLAEYIGKYSICETELERREFATLALKELNNEVDNYYLNSIIQYLKTK